MSAYCLPSWSDFLITLLVKEVLFDSQHINIGCLSFREGTTKEEHYHITKRQLLKEIKCLGIVNCAGLNKFPVSPVLLWE